MRFKREAWAISSFLRLLFACFSFEVTNEWSFSCPVVAVHGRSLPSAVFGVTRFSWMNDAWRCFHRRSTDVWVTTGLSI